MSILLMSLVWEIKFPTQTQKLVMLKMADHSSDDGMNIYPSNEVLAYQIGCDVRSIQRAIKVMDQAGVLINLHRGGKGDGDTNQWQLNVELLMDLAMREKRLVVEDGCGKVVESQGDILPPSAFVRVTRARLRVTRASSEGDTGATQTTINHQIEPPNARERAREEPRASRAVKNGSAKPRIVLTQRHDELHFGLWLDRMAECNRDDLATAARDGGTIEVTSKWPPPDGLQGLISAGSVDVLKRKLGGDA